jgi:hypothetical protein
MRVGAPRPPKPCLGGATALMVDTMIQLYKLLFRWIVSAAVIVFFVTILREYLHAGQVLSLIGQQWGEP